MKLERRFSYQRLLQRGRIVFALSVSCGKISKAIFSFNGIVAEGFGVRFADASHGHAGGPEI